MTILFLFVLMLLFVSPDSSCRSASSALSYERMLPWKGLCVLLILLSHYTGYIPTVPEDDVYLLIRTGMGQTVVVLFFFAAGYGMTLKLAAHGKQYLLRILKKAALLWFTGAVSVLLMIPVQYLRGRAYDLSTLLLAFVPVVNLGNSPWFIFAMILCYLFFLASSIPYALRSSTPSLLALLLLHSLLCAGYIAVLMHLGFEEYWYDTVLLFPFGILCAILQLHLPAKWSHGPLSRTAMLALTVTAVAYFYCYQTQSFFLHELYMTASCCLILSCALLYTPGSRILRFMGQHALVIYLFQRFPMILFYETGLLDMVPHLGFFPTLCCTCLIAQFTDKVKESVFRKEKVPSL